MSKTLGLTFMASDASSCLLDIVGLQGFTCHISNPFFEPLHKQSYEHLHRVYV